MSRHSQQITNDDEPYEALLRHIARYRLSTFAIMAKLFQLGGKEAYRLRQLLKQASTTGDLASKTLHNQSRYWFLTRKGADRLHLGENRSGPLSDRAKIRAYALLLFCCNPTKLRHRLEADELSSHFPNLHRSGMPSTYCFAPDGDRRITLVRVDAGQQGRWDRIISTVQKDVTQHLRTPGFRQLIDSNRFSIAVVTVLQRKAHRIAEALNTLPDFPRVPLEIVAHPELLHLTTTPN